MSKVDAIINICRTFMVCCLLGFSSYYFNRDSRRLVLDPLERMMERIQLIAENPMALCGDDDQGEGVLAFGKKKKKKADGDNEAQLLETSLIKIGKLLGLCFGVAGSQIIGQNMATKKGSKDFNPQSGNKIMSIFGFCDIRGFGEVTEVLQAKIMTFVNSIAEVVHKSVDQYSGASNKNLGEAFLFVWKFPESEVEYFDGEVQIIEGSEQCTFTAEFAVMSFLKCSSKINQYKHILEYSRDPRLTAVIPGFKVNMGFGLHYGWAIEGAIGSHFKIDASYLSPNVNIAARLEVATRQYGILILISGELHDLCSEEFQNLMRCVDVATVKGSAVPMRFFTINLNTDHMKETDYDLLDKTIKEKKESWKKTKQETKMKIFERVCTTYQMMMDDPDFALMFPQGTEEFDQTYKEAFNQYVKGDW